MAATIATVVVLTVIIHSVLNNIQTNVTCRQTKTEKKATTTTTKNVSNKFSICLPSFFFVVALDGSVPNVYLTIKLKC